MFMEESCVKVAVKLAGGCDSGEFIISFKCAVMAATAKKKTYIRG